MVVFDGRHLRVDRCYKDDKYNKISNDDDENKKTIGNGAALYDRALSVFIGNLPFDIEDEEIYSMFSTTSSKTSLVSNSSIPSQCLDQLEAVRIVRDKNTNVGKGE